MSDEGIQKAATLMLALGEDAAAEVMKHLGPREVQKIGAAMATIVPSASNGNKIIKNINSPLCVCKRSWSLFHYRMENAG